MMRPSSIALACLMTCLEQMMYLNFKARLIEFINQSNLDISSDEVDQTKQFVQEMIEQEHLHQEDLSATE